MVVVGVYVYCCGDGVVVDDGFGRIVVNVYSSRIWGVEEDVVIGFGGRRWRVKVEVCWFGVVVVVVSWWWRRGLCGDNGCFGVRLFRDIDRMVVVGFGEGRIERLGSCLKIKRKGGVVL